MGSTAGHSVQHADPPRAEADRANGQSALGAAFTLVKCNWGIGMMAMPYMLDQAGTIAGVIMFVISMGLTQLSIARLLDVAAALQRRSTSVSVHRPLLGAPTETEDTANLDYSGIMQLSLGSAGELLSLASIVVSAWGSCIAYLLFIKDNCHKLFGWPDYTWVLIAGAPLLLLSILDDVRFLAPISVFGLGCAFTFACLVVAEFFIHVDGQAIHTFFNEQPVVQWESFPLAMSIAAFCNEGIVILTPSTRNSMKRPSTFLHVSGWSIVFFTTCYMAVGLAGNIRFVGNVKAQLSLSFDTGGGWDDTANLPNRIAILLYCFQLIPTYAVVYFCAYEAVELKALRSWGMGRYTADHRKLKPQIVLVRWFWVALSGAIALVVPKFGDYLGLIGAVATSLAIYILPHVAWLKECRSGKPVGTAISVLTTAFGCVLAVWGTIQSVQGMLAAPSGSSSGSGSG